MYFTKGRDKFYESVMREPPNANKGKHPDKRQNQPFQYEYADVNCEYCMYHRRCGFEICPEIMENLDDLVLDNKFRTAVENADQCTTAHKTTLMKLKKYFCREDFDAGI